MRSSEARSSSSVVGAPDPEPDLELELSGPDEGPPQEIINTNTVNTHQKCFFMPVILLYKDLDRILGVSIIQLEILPTEGIAGHTRALPRCVTIHRPPAKRLGRFQA
jgi:hypothetical protein